jgi:predicted nucleic acid-binding protein
MRTTADMALYLDTSALVKLVAVERQSEQLEDFVGERRIISSQIATTELIRAIARRHAGLMEAAEDLVADMSLLAVDEELTTAAAWILPWSVRSLDALHLASAQSLGAALEAMVTYDKRMAEAGRTVGLRVMSPGDEAA